MLQEFRVDNFKSLINIVFKPQEANLLIGANNAGKTNLCQAMRFVSASSFFTLDVCADQTVNGRVGMTNFALDKSTIDFFVRADMPYEEEHLTFEYTLTISPPQDRLREVAVTIDREVLSVSGGAFDQTLLLNNKFEAVPSVVESRWRLLPGCGISRVLIRKERPPMKKPYTIVPDASTPSSRELADWLAKDGQLLVPLVELLEKGERAIDEVIDVMGRATVEAVLKMSAEQVAGPKEQGRRDADRELYWHGVQAGRVALKERQLRVAKPRLRKKRPRAGESGEVEIPAYTALQGNRRLADRMLELMLHGVSTRKYEPVLPAMAEQVGISKSEVSRETIEAGTRVLQELAERDLSELDVLVVYLDGIQFADYHVLAAVGVDADGRKHVLGLCGGASENTTVTISLLEDLVTRGLRADRRRLFVIDGAQALRKAIGQVFGSSHLVQRCRNHKLRNVLGHLPKEQQEQARSTLRAAWKLDAEEGIRKLEQYASWLEREWPSAAASLREGLAELFTVNRLGLPQSLRRCLTTTNIIDSSHAGVRQHTDRVSRWRNEEMAVRWAAVTFRETEKHYRRITGYEHLWMLKAHLDEEKDGVLAGMQKVG